MIALELRVVSLSSARSFRTRTMGLCPGQTVGNGIATHVQGFDLKALDKDHAIWHSGCRKMPFGDRGLLCKNHSLRLSGPRLRLYFCPQAARIAAPIRSATNLIV